MELVQFPICEALKIDKRDPAVIADATKIFIDDLRGNVTPVAWKSLNFCYAIMCPDDSDVNQITEAVTFVKAGASTAKPSPGSHDAHALCRALHSYNQAVHQKF